MKKIITFFVIFLLVGELTVRLNLFLNSPEKIHYSETKKPSIKDHENNIWLFGDSYSFGQGIEYNDRLANNIFKENYNTLDFTNPGDNWLDYKTKLFDDDLNFKENDIIFIGVNWNDVNFYNGSLLKGNLAESITIKTRKTYKSYIKILYNSFESIRFLSSQIQNHLKRLGTPLPIGDFYFFKEIAYQEKRDELDSLKKEINNLIFDKNLRVILFLIPDFNLLDRREYMVNFHEYFMTWKSNRIKVINGYDLFQNKSDVYYLDIFDGHPNGKAHHIISERINDEIDLIVSGFSD